VGKCAENGILLLLLLLLLLVNANHNTVNSSLNYFSVENKETDFRIGPRTFSEDNNVESLAIFAARTQCCGNVAVCVSVTLMYCID